MISLFVSVFESFKIVKYKSMNAGNTERRGGKEVGWDYQVIYSIK